MPKTEVEAAIAMERIEALTGLMEQVITEQRSTNKSINALVVQMARKEEKDDALTTKVDKLETKVDLYYKEDKSTVERCKKQHKDKDSLGLVMKSTWFRLAAVALVCGMAIALGVDIPGVTK